MRVMRVLRNATANLGQLSPAAISSYVYGGSLCILIHGYTPASPPSVQLDRCAAIGAVGVLRHDDQ
jgi:hypothetical protein